MVERGHLAIRFEGRIGLDAIFGEEMVTKVTSMASPTGTYIFLRPEYRLFLPAAA